MGTAMTKVANRTFRLGCQRPGSGVRREAVRPLKPVVGLLSKCVTRCCIKIDAVASCHATAIRKIYWLWFVAR